jgi:hypothetical protein
MQKHARELAYVHTVVPALRNVKGICAARAHPEMIGAMFWTIDADRQDNYKYSNLIGPQLHNYPKTK